MGVSRRRFLALGGATGALGLGATLGHRVAAQLSSVGSVSPGSDPFTLGVASGDPWPDSVVLWTRLVRDWDEPDGAIMGSRPCEVRWQLANDERMNDVERHGTTWALPEHAHAVHVVADGLRPGRQYWYRFRCGPWLSPTARTRTAPLPGQRIAGLDLVAASCQAWDAGYYTAHRHLAAEMPDVVLFLGDYIYERPARASGRGENTEVPDHLAGEATTLSTYRARYAWYKRDADLQAAHHAAPWIVTWDDHEVQDNYAADVPDSQTSTAAFVARRTAAYQAYWEHLPLRTPRPVGPQMKVHRRLGFGSLATFHVLDTRQHRSDQVAGDAWQRTSPDRTDRRRTMLGRRQQRWLEEGLAGSSTTWNVVAQQVIASRLAVDPRDGGLLNVDTWDGYPAAQRLLHRALMTTRNPVVLTGDLHAGYAFDIQSPLADPDGDAVGVEFATTSISSGGDGTDLSESGRQFLDANRHLHYASQRRGYLRCRLTPDELTADFRTVPYVSGRNDAAISTDRSFAVDAGARTIRSA